MIPGCRWENTQFTDLSSYYVHVVPYIWPSNWCKYITLCGICDRLLKRETSQVHFTHITHKASCIVCVTKHHFSTSFNQIKQMYLGMSSRSPSKPKYIYIYIYMDIDHNYPKTSANSWACWVNSVLSRFAQIWLEEENFHGLFVLPPTPINGGDIAILLKMLGRKWP